MELLAREYAVSVGVSVENVLNWISSGAIPASLVRRSGRRIFIKDATAASNLLTEKGLLRTKPKGGSGGAQDSSAEPWEERSIDEWATKEKYFRAADAELDLRIKQKKFIDAAEAQSEIDRMIVATKTKLLSVPSQLAQRVEVSKVVRETVDALIREALEELHKELSEDE